jgi:tetraacyldisaccharide 4'-kinase
LKKNKFHALIQNIWYAPTPAPLILRPFSAFFSVLAAFRKILYQTGLKKTTNFQQPIIIVGNITVGGSGKTPLVIALANFLQTQGYQPGIISRGYKGKNKTLLEATAQSNPIQVGDEAILLARQTNCPVVICPNRVRGVSYLLEKKGCNVILSDDGLQHLALGRSIEIAVIDASRGFGNGFLLPAGPLRESTKRLKNVDFCIINGGSPDPKWIASRQFCMYLIAKDLLNVKNPLRKLDLTALADKKIHAVAAIGHPGNFFQTLKKLGISIIEHPFPDHHLFDQQDFAFLNSDDYVIMTEKDAVKCETFADERYWQLPVSAQLPANFFTIFLGKLVNI